MRFGSIILLPLLALIGFGFFLAYSINLSSELIETRAHLAQVQAERQALEAQYQALVEEKNHLTVQLSGLAGENTDLRLRLGTLESERQTLSSQVETMQAQLNHAQRTNLLLSGLFSSSVGRLAATLVVPIIPLSLGAVYAITRPKGARKPTLPRSLSTEPHTKIQATLTREEFHLITQRRRSRIV
jgi:hypothetical protein